MLGTWRASWTRVSSALLAAPAAVRRRWSEAMRIDIFHHIVADGSPPPWAVDLIAAVQALGATMSTKTDELAAAVAAERDVVNSAVTLIQGLADQIAAANGDAAAIDAVIADVRAQAQSLGSAVAANTPAAPTA